MFGQSQCLASSRKKDVCRLTGYFLGGFKQDAQSSLRPSSKGQTRRLFVRIWKSQLKRSWQKLFMMFSVPSSNLRRS